MGKPRETASLVSNDLIFVDRVNRRIGINHDNSSTITSEFDVEGTITSTTLVLDNNIATPANYSNGLQVEVKSTTGTSGISLNRSGNSYVGIYHDEINKLKFKFNGGDVTLEHDAGTLWGTGNQGSGSGLNADTVDGYHADNFIGKNGNTHFQLTTWLQSTGTHGFYSPNSTAGTHFYPGDLGNYGSYRVDGKKNGWSGYSIEGRVLFMHNGSNTTGIYDDVNNKWLFKATHNGAAELYYNGDSKIQTTDAGATVTGNLTTTSDIKLKKNIENIDNALSKILKLQGVYFDWKDDSMGNKRNIGFIAQDVEKIVPELVTENQVEIKDSKNANASIIKKESVKNISYNNITALLVEAIKEQQTEINKLREEIKTLSNKLDSNS